MTSGFFIALPGSARTVAKHPAATVTCDANGNWNPVSRPLWRDANGWHDDPSADVTVDMILTPEPTDLAAVRARKELR